MDIAATEVLARWAYSEIVDGTLRDNYDSVDQMHQLERLRALRSSLVAFENLSAQDTICLAYLCISARSVVWCNYLKPIRFFQVSQLTKHKVEQLLVMPQVASEELNGRPESLANYLARPLPPSNKDCRHVGLKPGEPYHRPGDPLTIGVLTQGQQAFPIILTDGYHRAVKFLRRAPNDATISAYVPSS